MNTDEAILTQQSKEQMTHELRDLRQDVTYIFTLAARYPRIGPRDFEDALNSAPTSLRPVCAPLPVPMQLPLPPERLRRLPPRTLRPKRDLQIQSSKGNMICRHFPKAPM